MKSRDKLFFNLLSFLFLVIIGLVIYQTREVDKQIKRWEAEIRRRQERGVEDPVLRETVDKMESELRSRLAETFELKEDPLNLTRVIHTRRFLKKMFGELPEVETRMRLAATVMCENGPAAVIKWQGRSQVVLPGGAIGDYRVESIGVNRAILVRPGERMTLVTEKAPDTISEEAKSADSGVGREPVIEVRQVSTGNN